MSNGRLILRVVLPVSASLAAAAVTIAPASAGLGGGCPRLLGCSTSVVVPSTGVISGPLVGEIAPPAISELRFGDSISLDGEAVRTPVLDAEVLDGASGGAGVETRMFDALALPSSSYVADVVRLSGHVGIDQLLAAHSGGSDLGVLGGAELSGNGTVRSMAGLVTDPHLSGYAQQFLSANGGAAVAELGQLQTPLLDSYIVDGLRLSGYLGAVTVPNLKDQYLFQAVGAGGGAGLDGLLGAEGLGQSLYAVDGLRTSGTVGNFLDTGFPTYLSDDFRASGFTALYGLAGADVLGQDAYLVDGLRLSGHVDNLLGTATRDLPVEGPYFADVTRLSGLIAAQGLAGADGLGSSAYVVDALRLSGQLSSAIRGDRRDGATAVVDRTYGAVGGGIADPVGAGSYQGDIQRLSAQLQTAVLAGIQRGR